MRALRQLGHDVVWVREASPGVPDSVVLAQAVADERVLLTSDKDFGRLAVRSRLPDRMGIVLLRLTPAPPGPWTNRVLTALATREDWCGVLAVIEDDRVRVRPLAPSGGSAG